MEDYQQGDLVWFDPGIGYLLPGEVVEFSRPAQVVTVQAVIGGKPQNFTLHNLETVKKRQDLGVNGFDDMIELVDLNEASLLWNIRIRYDKEIVYTYTGSILVAVNPYKMFDIYGLEMVKKYEGQILGTLPPHLFAIGSSAYGKMSKDYENQVVVISGESGAGKTESTKLIMQYLAAVNKSPSNLITEQILEASPLLESFGNAKTVRNDNSSRFGKYLEVHFKDGVITGAKTTEYLLEKSRIVTQALDERNYHVFYEMLAGLSESEKEKYGLQSADNYFYLNQGSAYKIECKDDAEDFRSLLSAMQVLGFTSDEQDTIFRMLASVLHFGNIYFHRKQLKHGQEGVEIGSDAEIRWASHLLQLSVDGILRALTTRTTEARNERVFTALNIDQALDARDAISKALYSSLFSWLVQRINKIVCKGSKKTSIAILDIFGFEDFKENSFEQLCINYANETLQFYFNKHVFKLEQQEYAREKIEWQPISYQDNQPVLNLIAKKPVGITSLLDDESNFPKATDLSFLEKCHYNHALNELYSRPRMSSMEFGIKHYAGQVWYSVDSFLDKNRDTLRSVVVDLLISSKLPMISKMFQELRYTAEAAKTINKSNGRFVTMKPRAPTVAARFHDSLQALVDTMAKCNPWFVRCIKPNNDKAPMKFDMPIVLEQLRYTGMMETIRIRKLGYPVRMKFQPFAERYRCLVPGRIPRGAPSREVCRVILDRLTGSRDQYQLGSAKVFLREMLEQALEKERVAILSGSVIVIQRHVRGYLARKKYQNARRSAIKIQSAYRGWRMRRRYNTVRKGIVKAQANYRMIRQKKEYDKIKAILARRRDAENAAMIRAKERTVREEQERTSRAVAGVNHLEIPAELAFIFSKLEDWNCVHSERNIIKTVGQVIKPPAPDPRLPLDIDQYAFTKFTNVYFKAHIWGMKREPIKTPFLAKSSEIDYQDSLAVFKLILRFMNDNNLSGKKERALGDYIVQKGLMNEGMRDEIICQLCNQTWKNENDANNERGWLLMSNCLGCFCPSSVLYKYLLKYVSDHAYDGYKGFCQRKLLQCNKSDPENARTYPPCLLEWKTNVRRANMALSVKFADGGSMYGPVESWTTGEDFASTLIKSRGIQEYGGWTVDLCDEGHLYELNGHDYVLDLISETEIPPAFPVCKSFFLVSADKTKVEREPQKINWNSSPHNPENINTFEIEVDEAPPAPVRHLPPGPRLEDKIRMEQRSYQDAVIREVKEDRQVKEIAERLARSQSKERIVEDGGMEIGLSKTSALNERYFENGKRPDIHEERRRTDVSAAVSREALGLSKTSRLNERYDVSSEREMSGLSETSKLNKRYIVGKNEQNLLNATKQEVQDSSSIINASNAWQELGLASSALNDRYFSRQDLHKTSLNDVSELGSRSHEASIRASGATQGHINGQGSLLNGRHLPTESDDRSRIPSPPLSCQTSNDGGERTDFDFSDINHSVNRERDVDQDTSKYSRTTESTRYIKYAAKSQPRPYSHSTRAHIDKSRETEYSGGARSSALSDTSEAPSLASHVRNVRIPSHTSDLDQYLDDLFNPVLDGNLDELSDARSLAASIKGGGKKRVEREDSYIARTVDEILEEDLRHLCDPYLLAKSLKGGGDESSVTSHESEDLDSYLDDLFSSVLDSDVEDLQNAESIASSLKGGGQAVGGVETQQRAGPSGLGINMTSTPNFPMSPLPSASQSATPMSAPTVNTNLPMFNLAGSPPPLIASPQQTMQFPYLPLYNISGMTVPMVDASQLIQQQLVQQQMMQLQQRAFLASAVQQNLQIQQHLMQQNQALQHLLQTSTTSPQGNDSSLLTQATPVSPDISAVSLASPVMQLPPPMLPAATPFGAPMFPPQQPFGLETKTPFVQFPSLNLLQQTQDDSAKAPPLPPKTSRVSSPPPPPIPQKTIESRLFASQTSSASKDMFSDVLSELRSRSGQEEPPVPRSQAPRMPGVPLPPPPPPPPPPPLSPTESQEKYTDVYGRAKTVRIGKWRWPPPRDDGSTGPPSSFIEFKMKKQQEKQGKDDDKSQDGADAIEFEEIDDLEMVYVDQKPVSANGYLEPPSKLDNSKQDSADSEKKSMPGSIGKLRISSEMRAKLEQLTMDHSVRSSTKDSRAKLTTFPTKKDEQPVKKLEENRKTLLQQKLGGFGFIGTDQIDTAPKTRTERPHEPARDEGFISVETAVTEGFKKDEESEAKDKEPSFVVENLVRSQVEKMERANREIRELREELGHPMAHPSRTSTQQGEYGPSSLSSSRYFSQPTMSNMVDKSQFDQYSQASRSIVYEESLASSRGTYSNQGGLSYHNDAKTAHALYSAKSHILPPPPYGIMKRPNAPSSIAASSSYYAPSTPVVPRHREPRQPLTSPKFMQENASSEKVEFEESSDFLNPVDAALPPVLDPTDQKTLENIKTKLFSTNTAPYFCYTKVPWELRVRKEVFSPNEKIETPLALHLVFCQVVQDSFSSNCLRLNREEKKKLRQMLESYSITIENMHANSHKLQMKRNVIDLAKDFPNYFSRLFPVSGGRNLPDIQLLGVSHSGVRLLRRERDAICDYLRVLDTLSFEDIAEVSVPRSSTLQILLCNGGWMTVYSHKAVRIKNMIERYCFEAAQGGHEYVRAVADYVTRESTLLSFRQGDIIRVVKNKNLHLDKGWFYGVLDTGEAGIFPCEYVVPLGKHGAQRNVNKTSQMTEKRQFSRIDAPHPVTQQNGVDKPEMLNDNATLWVESKLEHVEDVKSEHSQFNQMNDGKYSLLQFALYNFRESLEKYEMLRVREGSLRGSIKMIESLKTSKKKNKKGNESDWTWKELADLVKYTKSPIEGSLLKFENPELNKLAVECFIAIMRYMGDYPMNKNQTEVDSVYTILVNCHKHPQLRDEFYCQIMKQTTNNKSPKTDSCQRGWRLFSIVAAYFECSDALRPYLFKYLETAAYDKRRACHGTAMVCLQNVRKTFKYSGRKNVPSIEEIAAISAGRNSKRQIYRLPGGTERVINTKSTTVVQDVIEEICSILSVRKQLEMEEFSLYCIVEGDPYTMPLNREEYILDVTTELHKNGHIYYLIFCRSVWYYPLRLDNQLYIEVIFNQVAPDYLEGLLLILSGEKLPDQLVPDIAKVASLLHRAADMEHMPTKEEVKYLLPKPVLSVKDIRPAHWVEAVQQNWSDVTALTTTEAKAQCLDILQKWPLFGSCFFIVKWIRSESRPTDYILALNREGVHFLDIVTHETVWKYPFAEVISTRKVRAEDGALFLDMKCGNLMVQKITRIQTDQAHEVSRLIRQYINIEQRHRGTGKDAPQNVTLSRHLDK